MGQDPFVHLHLHSHYSLLDGANRIEDVVGRAAELKMPALALTDHGNLFGAVQFHDAAIRAGIKPIIGCEAYVAREGRRTRGGRSDRSNHLVLLCKNEVGYRNLIRLISLGYQEGFYYRPRIDLELLSRYSDGLIGLSACLKGIVAWNVMQDRFDEAATRAGELSEILGPGNFYLELQDHGIEEQARVNEAVIKLSRSHKLPLVATNDCHYLLQDDSFAHDVLLCVQTGKTIYDRDRLSYKTDQFFFKTAREMEELFGNVPGALANTLEIAEKCDFRLGPTESVFPEFEVPQGHTIDSYFERIARDGFEERLPVLQKLEREGRLRHGVDEYGKRLDEEIRLIQEMKFPGYFLIVWDFIRYAREEGIPVGPGRGSVAGSLVSYALKITNVDPIQYDLLFERFLNPERVTPPDIDIDFCMHGRSRVIDYVMEKYGRDNVCQIITFGTMAARGAIRDVGRALNVAYADVDKLAKLVPQEPHATLSKAMSQVRELRDLASSSSTYEQLMTVAQQLEGLVRHASTHAAGVVIAPRPLIDLIPLYKTPKDDVMTQYPMTDLERLGLLKMDFLALTTLTVIDETLQQIRKQTNVDLDLSQIELDDRKTLKLFCDGRTSGIFQFESGGMRDILRRLQPDRFEDLIALNALYRPGPIQGGMIDDFIKRRHGKVRIEYVVPQLEEILEETYGVIVYQEQVMRIASLLGGFSLGEADLLRRAMGKKKKTVMEKQRKRFLAGARERGLTARKAEHIFQLMAQFAGYGFNKSHSTAYALLAYQTAYLKVHFSVQFMAAMLTSEMGSTDKVVRYLSECKEMGITVRPPDVNDSDIYFRASEDQIVFGLAAIKNVGEGAVQSVIECRNEIGPFENIFQFCENVDLRVANKRVLESLIKAGVFDSLHPSRQSLMEVLDRAVERGQKAHRDRLSGQIGLFGDSAAATSGSEEVPFVGDWPDREQWGYEKETLGFYVTGHPLQKYEQELRKFSLGDSARLGEEMAGRETSIGGMVTALRRLQTRKGASMATFQLEDLSGTVEVVVFPNCYEKCSDLLSDSDQPVLVRGRCEVDGRGEVRLIAAYIAVLDSLWKRGVEKMLISVSVPSIDPVSVSRLQDLIHRNPGSCPLEFEILKRHRFRIRLIPNEPTEINPGPAFVDEVEKLFGENSVTLYT